MLSIGHKCYCSWGRPMRAWRNKIRGNIGGYHSRNLLRTPELNGTNYFLDI